MLIDLEALKSHFDGDIEIIEQLTEVFEQSYGESLSGLEQAIAENDFPNIKLHAHTLKGMISNFFAEDLRQTAFFLEQCGNEQNLKDDYQVKLDYLKNEIPALISELKNLEI